MGCPVIDFSIDRDGQVWVLVDGEKTGEAATPLVRLLNWADGMVRSSDFLIVHRLTEVQLAEVSENDAPALLAPLNTQCKIPGTYGLHHPLSYADIAICQ